MTDTSAHVPADLRAEARWENEGGAVDPTRSAAPTAPTPPRSPVTTAESRWEDEGGATGPRVPLTRTSPEADRALLHAP